MDDIKNFDALCVIWKNPYTNKKYRIGILCKDKKNGYSFTFLSSGLQNAREDGLYTELGFNYNDPYRIYNSSDLFIFFKLRRPIGDSFEQLKNDGGKVITDNLSFEKIIDEDIKQFKIDNEKRKLI